MSEISREVVISAAKEIAGRLRVNTLRREDFARESGITLHQIYTLFADDGWRGVLAAAGLQIPVQNVPISDDTLLEEFHRVVVELGGIPTGLQFETRANVSKSTLTRRFHGIPGTLLRYREWLEQNHPNAPELQFVRVEPRNEVAAPLTPLKSPTGLQQWERSDGTIFGAPISFRGLRHAPINEQGVVYLFGMVSSELGLIVEAVQSAYPDCEAKRCIDSKNDRWQRIRIEFEFRSRNFCEHGHEPSRCDMIVCWEHNWPECPLEVVELRSVIDQLDPTVPLGVRAASRRKLTTDN